MELQENLGLLGLLISLGVAIVGAIVRYTIARQDAERERRFEELERNVERLKTTAHTSEVAVVRVEGQLAVLRSEHESVTAVLEEIRAGMLPRREWEARMQLFEESLRGIREQIQTLVRLVGQVEGSTGGSRGGPPSRPG